MQNNQKTNNRNHSSSIRDFIWFIYKRFLIGLAMYFCYKCLHFSPLTYDITELALCFFIILIFSAIIAHHETAKKAADYPDQLIFPSPLAMIGGGLSWVIYIGLILYVFFWSINGSISAWLVIFIIVINEIIAPNSLRHILFPFGYLNR